MRLTDPVEVKKTVKSTSVTCGAGWQERPPPVARNAVSNDGVEKDET